MKLTYHTEGARAFLLEDDGTTVCEVLPPLHGMSAAAVARGFVMRWNVADELYDALKALIDDQRDASLPVLAKARAAMATLEGDSDE